MRKKGACINPPGYDAGKKIKGKKRHILVDTVGLMLHAVVHPADIQDRDGGVPMRWVVERTLAWLNRCRRVAEDFENLSRNALAFLQLASIRLMLRKLCNPT